MIPIIQYFFFKPTAPSPRPSEKHLKTVEKATKPVEKATKPVEKATKPVEKLVKSTSKLSKTSSSKPALPAVPPIECWCTLGIALVAATVEIGENTRQRTFHRLCFVPFYLNVFVCSRDIIITNASRRRHRRVMAAMRRATNPITPPHFAPIWTSRSDCRRVQRKTILSCSGRPNTFVWAKNGANCV